MHYAENAERGVFLQLGDKVYAECDASSFCFEEYSATAERLALCWNLPEETVGALQTLGLTRLPPDASGYSPWIDDQGSLAEKHGLADFLNSQEQIGSTEVTV